jgi:hypothetical protein
MFNPDIDFIEKAYIIFLIFFLTFASILIYSAKDRKSLTEEESVYHFKKITTYIYFRIPVLLCLFFGLYMMKDDFEISDYVHYTVITVITLLCILHDAVDYRKCLNLDSNIEMNKVKRLFLKYNIELFVVGLILLVASFSYMFNPDYDFIYKMLILFIGGLVSIPILCIAVSKNLFWTRVICIIYASITTPLAVFLFIYEFMAYEGDISKHIIYIIAGVQLLIFNVTVYRSYLNIKYANEMEI